MANDGKEPLHFDFYSGRPREATEPQSSSQGSQITPAHGSTGAHGCRQGDALLSSLFLHPQLVRKNRVEKAE